MCILAIRNIRTKTWKRTCDRFPNSFSSSLNKISLEFDRFIQMNVSYMFHEFDFIECKTSLLSTLSQVNTLDATVGSEHGQSMCERLCFFFLITMTRLLGASASKTCSTCGLNVSGAVK